MNNIIGFNLRTHINVISFLKVCQKIVSKHKFVPLSTFPKQTTSSQNQTTISLYARKYPKQKSNAIFPTKTLLEN